MDEDHLSSKALNNNKKKFIKPLKRSSKSLLKTMEKLKLEEVMAKTTRIMVPRLIQERSRRSKEKDVSFAGKVEILAGFAIPFL